MADKTGADRLRQLAALFDEGGRPMRLAEIAEYMMLNNARVDLIGVQLVREIAGRERTAEAIKQLLSASEKVLSTVQECAKLINDQAQLIRDMDARIEQMTRVDNALQNRIVRLERLPR